jgi:hypothetical protein
MRTKGRGAPDANSSWDEIVPLLWMGGHYYQDSLGVRQPDSPLTTEQLEVVCEMAELAARSVTDGRRVLVRCHSGYNRSGLVIAQALIHLGHSADDAVFLIRYRRSKWALNNPLFVSYLDAAST